MGLVDQRRQKLVKRVEKLAGQVLGPSLFRPRRSEAAISTPASNSNLSLGAIVARCSSIPFSASLVGRSWRRPSAKLSQSRMHVGMHYRFGDECDEAHGLLHVGFLGISTSRQARHDPIELSMVMSVCTRDNGRWPRAEPALVNPANRRGGARDAMGCGQDAVQSKYAAHTTR